MSHEYSLHYNIRTHTSWHFLCFRSLLSTWTRIIPVLRGIQTLIGLKWWTRDKLGLHSVMQLYVLHWKVNDLLGGLGERVYFPVFHIFSFWIVIVFVGVALLPFTWCCRNNIKGWTARWWDEQLAAIDDIWHPPTTFRNVTSNKSGFRESKPTLSKPREQKRWIQSAQYSLDAVTFTLSKLNLAESGW